MILLTTLNRDGTIFTRTLISEDQWNVISSTIPADTKADILVEVIAEFPSYTYYSDIQWSVKNKEEL